MSTELNNALMFFLSTFGELAALFIIISFIVSIINYLLPPQQLNRLLSGNRGYGIAVALGAITPFCSCSTLPMTIGLIKARAAFGPIMAFLFTSPLLNPFIVVLFWASFGASITIVYTGFVLLLAVCSGYLLSKMKFERFIRKEILAPTCSAKACNSEVESTKVAIPQRAPLWSVKYLLLKDAIKQFVTFTPYLMLGVVVGAFLHGFVPESFFANVATLNSAWLIPLSAIIGVFLYIRASTMVPIAASLVAKGMSMGAIISLTIGGAGASLPEMIMMKKMFRWPLILAFIGLVFSTACLTGFAVDWMNLGQVL